MTLDKNKNLFSTMFPQQLAFLKDPSKRKVLFCPRRSGKSYAISGLLIEAALQNDNVKCIYIALTKGSAYNILWNNILQPILDENKIKYKYHKSNHTVTFANESTIRLTGGDVGPGEVSKLLGGKYFLVVLDECGVFKQDLKKMIEDDIDPATTDYITEDGGGTIVLCGTPSDKQGKHYFYQITKEDERLDEGWNIHSWTIFDNPYMTRSVKLQFAKYKKDYGDGYTAQPWFQREWLCKWVLTNEMMVYAYDAGKNKLPVWHDPKFMSTQPEEMRAAIRDQYKDEYATFKSIMNRDRKWNYVIGIDLGFVDATAIVVGCYCMENKIFYVVESSKQTSTIYSEIAEKLKILIVKYKPVKIVCDTGGGGRQGVEELRRTHLLPIVAADKPGVKHIGIARMNSDFLTGQIKVCHNGDHEANTELIHEWKNLVWDQSIFNSSNGRTRTELSSCENHLADACLYAYRASYHFAAEDVNKNDKLDIVTQWRMQIKKAGIPCRPVDNNASYEELMDEDELSKYVVELIREERENGER